MKHIAFLFILVIFIGCGKSDILDRNSEKFSICNIMGIVNTDSNFPVEGAIVNFNGINTTTDTNGVYFFEGVEVSSLHNIVKIQKEGYHNSSRLFTSNQESILRQNTNLSRKEPIDYNPTNSLKYYSNYHSTDIKANTIVLESGQSLSATGNLYSRYLSPYDFDEAPGNFVGLDKGNNHCKLFPIGIIRFEMEDLNGFKLKIKDGEKVKIEIKIFSQLLNQATDEIPLWLYNDETGYWVERGFAKKEGDIYVGEVDKLGVWGCCLFEPSTIYNGRIINKEGKNINSAIKFAPNKNFSFIGTTEQYTTGGEFTNYDGSFSFWASKNEKLDFSFWTEGAETYKYEAEPCQEDCTLNNISLPDFSSTQITGRVVDCDNNPLRIGYIFRDTNFGIDYYLPVVNGVFYDNVITYVVGTVVSYVAIDMNTREKCLPLDVPISIIPGNKDVGTLIACKN